ncbi:NAC domain-containing protein 2-like [Papaver somniferum]|uniref:NAC domain-containing protein 2-like n=1 Tax=Papaver somniferum TaxID=3469 RepID=UPI000E703B1F|nr:NAC domain-containing protein 2-like [Papaver somniferum]
MVLNKGVLPPGYKFMPSDKQIIKDYLVRKVQNTLPDVSWFILEKDIYRYSNPFLLFQEIQRNQGYFFTPITKVSSCGKNVNRKTGDGTWSGQKPTTLKDDDKKPIGTKRMYNFEWNVPKEKKREVEREKGHWIMHEYSLLPDYYTNNNIKADPEYVLCEIRCKIPIFDVHGVRQKQPQSQPVAKRQRTSPSTDAVPAVEPPANNRSSISWVPSPLPAETSTSKFVDLEAAPVFNNVESSSDWVASSPPVFNNVESHLNNGKLSEASAPVFSNAELSEWVPSQPPAMKTTDPYVPVPVPPAPTSMLSASMPDFDEFLNDDGWEEFFSFDNNGLPAVKDSLNTTTPDNNEWENLDDLLPTSEDKLNSSTPRDNSYTYYDSRKVLKASDSEAVKISKLGWDPVAYKAYFPNFEPMY